MSHSLKLTESQINCNITGSCSEYNALLQQADGHIDSHNVRANQSAITSGTIIGVIGLIILLTPFVKQFQRLQRLILPKLTIAGPVIFGIIASAAISFVLTIIVCFEFECTSNVSTSILAIPLFLSLFITIPISMDIYRKRQKVALRINKLKPAILIVVGCLIILVAAIITASTISENNSNKAYEKRDLQNLINKQ